MSSIWQSYDPYHVVCDLVLHPHADSVGREQRFEAVALFADVSGFTAISEARFVYFRPPRSTKTSEVYLKTSRSTRSQLRLRMAVMSSGA